MEPTKQQKSIINLYRVQYGEPDKIVISDGWDHIIRMDWCEQKRHLFIDSVGERVVWKVVDI